MAVTVTAPRHKRRVRGLETLGRTVDCDGGVILSHPTATEYSTAGGNSMTAAGAVSFVPHAQDMTVFVVTGGGMVMKRRRRMKRPVVFLTPQPP